MKKLLFALLALALLPRLGLGAGATALSEADRAFFLELKKAILAGDKAWLSDRICFPLLVQIDDQERTIRNQQEFLDHYLELLPVSVTDAMRRQSSDMLVKTERGIMVGNGELWYKEVSELSPVAEHSQYCVTTISARSSLAPKREDAP